MDGYLDRLKVGGHLVIATPLMSNNFYDDFDHVRPYQSLGILMVFGGGAAQVQYYARKSPRTSRHLVPARTMAAELFATSFRDGPTPASYAVDPSRLRASVSDVVRAPRTDRRLGWPVQKDRTFGLGAL